MCEYIGHETNPCAELEVMAGTVAKLGNELEQVQRERDAALLRERDYRNQVEQVKVWVREVKAGWSGSDSEFAEYYDDLAEMLGVEFTETIEVELTLSQTIRVTKPIGTDIDESDFYTCSYVEIYSNSDEVEVIEHLSDASIDEVN